MSVAVSIAVQAHASRRHLAEPLAAQLDAEIVYDPNPDGGRSTWRTYRAALERTPDTATHRLIVQDDATPCPGFAAAATKAIAACPESLIAFWHGGRPRENIFAIRRAFEVGCPWAQLRDRVIPIVALSWPTDVIAPALEFVDSQRWRPEFNADDEIAARIVRHLGLEVCATVPSLVQHADVVPSVKSVRAKGGKDSARVAAYFIGDADPSAIRW